MIRHRILPEDLADAVDAISPARWRKLEPRQALRLARETYRQRCADVVRYRTWARDPRGGTHAADFARWLPDVERRRQQACKRLERARQRVAECDAEIAAWRTRQGAAS